MTRRRIVVRKPQVTFQDVHHTSSFRKRFLASLSEQIDRIVICSPYFDSLPKPFDDILKFCISQQRRNVKLIQIITRPPGSDDAALSENHAKELSRLDVEIFVRTSPYLHAKFYHFDYNKGFFRSFVGSSNFTMGGFKGNYELVAELEGVGQESPCHREIARMQNQGAISYQGWVEHGCLDGLQGKSDA